jgi:hypothetical protein
MTLRSHPIIDEMGSTNLIKARLSDPLPPDQDFDGNKTCKSEGVVYELKPTDHEGFQTVNHSMPKNKNGRSKK